MPSIAVTTLGCKVNHYESAGIIERLTEQGYDIVPFSLEADVYIINTCTVTTKTDYQSRQLVRRARKRNPEASIIVTGCYAQIAPEVLAELPGVTLVVGTEAKERIPELVNTLQSSKAAQKIYISDISRMHSFSGLPVTEFHGQTRAYLKIQDGCNAFCSYCIIPYARGPSRSMLPDQVIEAVRFLQHAGYREVILTGIHLGLYGHDLDSPTTLAALIRRIELETSLERLRISSIEPREITDFLVNTIATSSIVCHHLHIPLQSGDDRVLARMKRTYTALDFRRHVMTIMERIPDIAVGADVITGFPGESEEEFCTTLSFIDTLPLAYLHVFPYSKRPGTDAAKMAGQVQESIKKERAKIIREKGVEKRRTFIARFIGDELSVLVEAQSDGAGGWLKGFSDNYISTHIVDADRTLINRIVSVTAEYSKGETIVGRIKTHG